jgi:hypothetical protein
MPVTHGIAFPDNTDSALRALVRQIKTRRLVLVCVAFPPTGQEAVLGFAGSVCPLEAVPGAPDRALPRPKAAGSAVLPEVLAGPRRAPGRRGFDCRRFPARGGPGRVPPAALVSLGAAAHAAQARLQG